MSLPKVYYNNDPTSFAFSTCQKRWPIIIGNCITDLQASISDDDTDLKKTQAQEIVSDLLTLQQDLKNDAEVKPFGDHSIPGLDNYDEILASLPEATITWLTGPWLFLECYLYRKINTFFVKRSEWADFDIFEKAKRDTFKSSEFGVTELAVRYRQLNRELTKTSKADLDIEALKLLFTEFIEVSLWGNATDLSLLANATLEDIKSVQGAEARKKSEKNILTNDLPVAWESLKAGNKRVDFILDNAGFENYTDLILSLFLLDSGLASQVVFHCKTRPWMVSDTMVKDFPLLLQDLQKPDWFPEHRDDIDFLVEKLTKVHASGQLVLRESEYWTIGADYWTIPQFPEVYNDLLKSDLIIVKGDLNYRKLTGDRHWPRATLFVKGIGPLASSGLKLLALRTCKADVCLGLAEGKDEELCAYWRGLGNDVGELWCSSGKWAVISYTDGRAE